MSTDASAASDTTERRIGRPPKVDEHGTPTRERLLDAAVAACIERGYEEATLSDIARRADVSTPAVYSHFAGKAELMITASKQVLERINADVMEPSTGSRGLVQAWMAPEAHQLRALLLELHRAAGNHPELRELLDEWQISHAQPLVERFGFSPARIKLLNLFMMGMLHLDDLGVLEADHDELVADAAAAILPLTRTSSDR
jgi:AcrR family transcriptional regulator